MKTNCIDCGCPTTKGYNIDKMSLPFSFTPSHLCFTCEKEREDKARKKSMEAKLKTHKETQ